MIWLCKGNFARRAWVVWSHLRIAGERRRRKDSEGKGRWQMSVYRRGDIWWYKFQFGGQTVRESSKSASKTVAKDAERARRRELEESWNQIRRRTLPPTFQSAGSAWLEAA